MKCKLLISTIIQRHRLLTNDLVFYSWTASVNDDVLSLWQQTRSSKCRHWGAGGGWGQSLGLGNNRSTFFIQIIFTRCLLYSSCSCCLVVLVRPPPPPSSINYTLRWVGMCAEEKKRCTSCRCERVSPTTDTEEFDTT